MPVTQPRRAPQDHKSKTDGPAALADATQFQSSNSTPPASAFAQTPDPRYNATMWGGPVLEDLKCPSGQLCQVRRIGPEGLIREGIIQSLDGLTAIVENELVPAAEGKPKVDVAKLMGQPEALSNMMHVIDRITCAVVVQPHVEMTPNDVTRRQSGVVYADMIDLEDKTFIMSYAMGGTRDVETFRQESAAALGSVDDQSEPQDQA